MDYKTQEIFRSRDSLIGGTIEPTRIELGWSLEEITDGYSLNGKMTRHEPLSGEELLEHGVFDFGGQGMPVFLSASVETDKDYKIVSFDISAYASNGPAYGRPIYVEVTEKDEDRVTIELARFLVEPQLGGGKLVEDKKWLEEALPKFKEMSSHIFLMSKELLQFEGKPISFDKAHRNGWLVDEDEGACYGYFELITDLERMSFWMGIAIEVDDSSNVAEVKCVLKDDEPPTPEEIDDFDQHEMVEGFNFARLKNVFKAIIQE